MNAFNIQVIVNHYGTYENYKYHYAPVAHKIPQSYNGSRHDGYSSKKHVTFVSLRISALPVSHV